MSNPQPTKPQPTDWYRLRVQNLVDGADESAGAVQNGGTADLYIYEAIGGWWGGVSASLLATEIAQLDVEQINLWVNSPGGETVDAIAIMNALRRHPATVTAYVDGMAASAASMLVCACDKVVMGANAQMMIHDAWTFVDGNAEALTRAAELVDRMSDQIAGVYAAKAGGTVENWRQLMRDETWYFAAEAVTAGLADELASIDVPDEAADELTTQDRFDLTVFAHAGRRNAPKPPALQNHSAPDPGLEQPVAASAEPGDPPAPPEGPNPEEEGPTMSDLNKGLRELLGVDAEAELDDSQLLEEARQALEERAEPAAAPAGTVNIDEATLTQLQADAAAGAQARERQVAEDREALVNAAIKDGKIPPARKDHWINALANDAGVADVLKDMPKGLIAAQASAYTGGIDEHADENDAFEKWQRSLNIQQPKED